LEVTVCEWFWCNSQDCVEWDDELHVCLRLAASCVSTTMLPVRWGCDVGTTKFGDIKIQSAMSKEEEEYSSVIGCKVAPMTKL
jgi:hypothetical protein